MLLSIYLRIYRPEVQQNGVEQIEEEPTPPPSQSLLIDNGMPPTWRQVKRITTAALVVVYAYWRGEATAEEASRFLASALLLLRCQCIRWRRELTGTIDTLRDLVELSGLSIGPALSVLLPGATFDFISAMMSSSSSHTEVCIRTPKGEESVNELNFQQPDIVGNFNHFEELLDKSTGSINTDPSLFIDYETWLPNPLVGLCGDGQ
jgi:hypothetical protein